MHIKSVYAYHSKMYFYTVDVTLAGTPVTLSDTIIIIAEYITSINSASRQRNICCGQINKVKTFGRFNPG